jgi:hypothetical protein
MPGLLVAGDVTKWYQIVFWSSMAPAWVVGDVTLYLVLLGKTKSSYKVDAETCMVQDGYRGK